MSLTVQLISASGDAEERPCLSAVLEREAYTPYARVTAEFPMTGTTVPDVLRIALRWEGQEVFLGLPDRVERICRKGVWVVRVQSRSFSSLLTQNELAKGLHPDLTIGTLVQGFYQFPFVTYEDSPVTGYIYVKEGSSLWDSICAFTYKQTRHHPYVVKDCVMISPPIGGTLHTVPAALVTAYGQSDDTTRRVSCIHMEDVSGEPDAYRETDAAAVALGIVRNRQIPFDRQFLQRIEDAMTSRLLFSQRGGQAVFVEYAGFADEELGERVTFGTHMQAMTICRVRMVWSGKGVRTRIWAYRDGYYNK